MPLPASNPAGQIVPPGWAAANRPAAQSALQDECTVQRPGTSGEIDPETGTVIDTSTVLATGEACRVSYLSLTAVERRLAADERVAVNDHLVQFALTFDVELRAGDEITITCVGPNADPALLGRTFRVGPDGAATYAWTRRVFCEHITHG